MDFEKEAKEIALWLYGPDEGMSEGLVRTLIDKISNALRTAFEAGQKKGLLRSHFSDFGNFPTVKEFLNESKEKEIPSKRCSSECDEVCDFCLHFLFYRDIDGNNIDGSGWCGLHRKKTDAGSGCKEFYCENRWEKDMIEQSRKLS